MFRWVGAPVRWASRQAGKLVVKLTIRRILRDAERITREAEQMNEIKPGYRTSEFWLTIVAQAVGALLASGAFEMDGAIGQLLGVIAIVLSQAGYAVSRGIAKRR